MVKMYVTPCMGIVAAGFASCICFLLINSLRKGRATESNKKRKKSSLLDDSRCACCLRPLLIDHSVDCIDCGTKSCRKSCSSWNQEEETWYCLFCRQRRTWLIKNKSWIETICGVSGILESSTTFNTARSQSSKTEVEHAAISHNLDLAAGGEQEGNSVETVRDIVEKIVEGLVGNVDNSPVDRIYNHPAYKTTASTTDMAHTALKELVERAVEEARKLPGLRSSETGKEKELSMTDRSYEDLLATAILNKVIEKFQNEYVDGNSNVLRGKSSARRTNIDPGSANTIGELNYFLSSIGGEIEAGLEKGQEYGSSLDPLSQDEYSSDCSAAQAKHLNNSQPLSLTIEERIEEATTTYTSDDDINHENQNGLDFRNSRRVPFPEFGIDILDPSQDSSDESLEDSVQDLVTPVESWEENWLFQKRKIHARSEPVSMLVPNASSEFRALIGDRDAEDISDLSECSAQSDEEIEQEIRVAISNVVPRTSESEKEPLDLEAVQLESSDNAKDHEVLDNYKKSNAILENGKQDINEKQKMGTLNINERKGSLELLKTSNKEGHIKRIDECEEISRTMSSQKEKYQTKNKTNYQTEKKDKIPSRIEAVLVSNHSRIDESIQKCSPENSEESKNVESIDESLNINSRRCPITTENNFEEENKKINQSLGESEDKDCKENILEGNVSKSKLLMTNGHHKVDGEDGIQQESEYTEHYDTATQKHMDSLTITYGPMGIDETDDVTDEPPPIPKIPPPSIENLRKCREAAEFVEGERTSHKTYLKDKKVDGEAELATPPRPGTIAEREHKKWENATPIQNNPYSQENIQKRLLERQYSRRSEISGNNAEVPKMTERPLQILLGAKKLDVKRFGRDYYINDAMIPSGDTQTKSGGNRSRPSSALSQHSNSGSDFEPQQNEKKVSRWQQNNGFNEESDFQSVDSRNLKSEKSLESKPTNEVTHCFNSEVIVPSVNWENSEVENLLEKERKNNKNEINARLNNQEILSTNSQPISDEKIKKIRRLDLRAYGFANDFRNQNFESPKPSQQRVVNKLDLKSFGYESGLRRTQSIQLDIRNHNEDKKPKIIKAKSKFSLNERREIKNEKDDNYDLTKSTEELNREAFQSGDYFAIRGMFSAKSVPNIADSQHYESSINVNMMKCKYEGRCKYSPQNDETEAERRNGIEIRNQSKGEIKGKILVNSAENISLQSETERSSEEGSSGNFLEKELPLPSVRRLAQAFSKSTEKLNPPKVSKIPNKTQKKRPTTPEIHLVETPRQMHSLTARSISKEFRDGLRQIPHKMSSPSANQGTIEQKICQNRKSIIENEKTSSFGDISTISSGNLKNNIQFWEQLQRRN
ncbi:uncharacterized protein LOC117180809 isoform X3 [Belonocnema kinseyi]|uniref:uncharacterized protein LOC117180809 isoform X3 n=1 Tax=Belonocnema kinseyi TaxID=2817044 RepID=UPI00143D386A|nr:uncharacterized protein LOC117180809 isoform X3 [Belonocnema kinseyi]